VRAIAGLAHAEIPEAVAQAYAIRGLRFGAQYLIPKPFDPRLIEVLAPAVAQAAADSGVAAQPITDLAAYRQRLKEFVYQTSSAMQPVFAAAKLAAQRKLARVAYAEGEDERVLRAAQIVIDEGLARPLLIGRQAFISARINEYGLRMKPGVDFDCIDASDEATLGKIADSYLLSQARGLSREYARAAVRDQPTRLGAVLLRSGGAEALLCGTSGRYADHVDPIRDIIGTRAGVATLATMQLLILPERQLFICDTQINADPSAEQVAEIAVLAAAAVRRFGIAPRVALLSHSNFGSSDDPSALKMRAAVALARQLDPTLVIAGEMRGDSALSQAVHDHEAAAGAAEFAGEANVLVMPNVDAANIAFNLLRIAAGNGIAVGGILLGAARTVHILAPSATVRRIVNMTAIAVADNQASRDLK
jgi:malate dehydrogenase (oxaloacetate-decarboxylating)(NADP+)